MHAREDGERDGAGAGSVLRLRAIAGSTSNPAQARQPMKEAAQASDESLMSAYRDGDCHAFEMLYARHRGGLYRFLLRQCGAAGIAEELFQDVWLNLIRARQRYSPQARFATYLYRIAHNRLIDYYRRAAHRPVLESDDEDDDPVARLADRSSLQPDILVQRKTQVERLMTLLAGLPDVQREAFVMREEAGLSVEEIAQATGVNAETAKSRLRYAVAKLRRGLQELV